MARQEPMIHVRLPPDLKERVRQAAEKNRRSVNAEIVHCLEQRYGNPNNPTEKRRNEP